MPYRKVAALTRYPVHNSAGYPVAVLLSTALTIGGPLALVLALPARMLAQHPFTLLLTALPGLVVLLAYISGSGAHRVAGGSGAIVLYPSHIVLPPPWGTKELVFPIDAVQLRRTTVRGRINFMQVSEVHVMEVSAGGRARTLSSRMFDDPATLDRLASDIERVRAGLDPERSDHAVPEPKERDRYDDAIDDELSML